MVKLGRFIGFFKDPQFKVINNKNTSLSIGVFSVLSTCHFPYQPDIAIFHNQSVILNTQLKSLYDQTSRYPGISPPISYSYSNIGSFLKSSHFYGYALPSFTLNVCVSLLSFVLISLLEEVKCAGAIPEIIDSHNQLSVIDDSQSGFLYHA